MMPKYTIEYAMPFKRSAEIYCYRSDDPVACEEFLEELLERGYRIQAILHEGLELPKIDLDKMIKTAGRMMVAKAICSSLGIPAEEEHYRFGFSG
jgi:hypothetical protein